jgi:DHA2 family methylenomycin A resistance protein-like MFS transporter
VALLLAFLGGAAALLENVRALAAPALAAACAGLVVVAAAFARRELRQAHPVLDVRVLRLRPVLAAGAAVASGNAALYTALLGVPLLVGSDRAVPLLLCLLVGGSAGSLVGGRLSDRWGRRRPALLGGVLLALASGGLVAVHLTPVGPAAAALLVGAGLGQGLAAAAVQTAGLEALPPERAGLASGVWSTSRYLGSIVGSSLLAVLVAGGSGHGVFALAAVGGALSVLAAAALPAPAPAEDRG